MALIYVALRAVTLFTYSTVWICVQYMNHILVKHIFFLPEAFITMQLALVFVKTYRYTVHMIYDI